MIPRVPRDVFISHASVDAELARAICEGLERRGLACWIAPRDVTSDGTYGAEIVKGLRECPVFLILLTGAAAQSQQVEREAERASHYQRRIIPVSVGHTEPGERLEFYTAGRQWVECTATIDDTFLDRLVAVVRGGQVGLPPPGRPRHASRTLLFAIVAAIVIASAAAGVWFATRDQAPPSTQRSDEERARAATVPDPERARPATTTSAPPAPAPSTAKGVVAPPPIVDRPAGKPSPQSESTPHTAPPRPTSPPVTTGASSDVVVNGARLRFVAVPGGTYTMGCSAGDDNCADDEKVLKEMVVRPFQISATEVTQAFWQATMGNNPSDFQGQQRPVEMVSWHDAVGFMARLNQLDSAFEYRLPTEAQWEYAARAGGGTPDSLRTFAWFDLLSSMGSAARPQDVATRKANVWGLHDMLGNVEEWCEDWYAPNSQRVVRGGAWDDAATALRVSARGKASATTKLYTIGVRVVRTPR